jgi:FlaA1/EpsC-like NDP-sugar epimerase
MSDGRHCPACGKDIGLWPVVAAPLPNLVRCPHCRTRLKYRGTAWLFVVVIFVALIVAVGAYAVAQRLIGEPDLLTAATAVIILVVAWVPIEVFLAAYLRRTKVLTRAGDGRQ